MQIILRNDFGEFIIGRGGNAKLISIDGLGIPQKETQTVSFSGQPGQATISMRDMPRAITMSVDFSAYRDYVLRLYRLIYHEVEIIIIHSDSYRRKTKGLCINPSDIESVIYGNMYKAVFQFVCDDPYFHDLYDTEYGINTRIDKLPNLEESGAWYINLPAVATERKTDNTVINKGAVKIYPVIEVYNNTDDAVTSSEVGLKVKNNTTGSVISIERDMKPGEKITLDLPHRKIKSDIDGDITNYISDDTVLSSFYLDTGENNIEVENKNYLQETYTIIKYNNNYEAAVI